MPRTAMILPYLSSLMHACIWQHSSSLFSSENLPQWLQWPPQSLKPKPPAQEPVLIWTKSFLWLFKKLQADWCYSYSVQPSSRKYLPILLFHLQNCSVCLSSLVQQAKPDFTWESSHELGVSPICNAALPLGGAAHSLCFLLRPMFRCRHLLLITLSEVPPPRSCHSLAYHPGDFLQYITIIWSYWIRLFIIGLSPSLSVN